MTVSELFGRAQSFCLLCKLKIKSNKLKLWLLGKVQTGVHIEKSLRAE